MSVKYRKSNIRSSLIFTIKINRTVKRSKFVFPDLQVTVNFSGKITSIQSYLVHDTEQSSLIPNYNFSMVCMTALHMGQVSSCRAHVLQNPLCWHGLRTVHAWESKQRVHASSFTVRRFNNSSFMCLKRIIN